jgi:hypothetical protein
MIIYRCDIDDMNRNSKRHTTPKLWLARMGLFVLYGPFLIVLGLGFVGYTEPLGGPFMVWLLAAATVGGAYVVLSDVASMPKTVKEHGIGEVGCILPIAAFPFWTGYLLLKEIGILE